MSAIFTKEEKKALLWHLHRGKRMAESEVVKSSEFIHPKDFFSSLGTACEKMIKELEEASG